MHKKMISALLVVVLMLTVSANAAFSVKSVMPALSLDISGSTAQCSALVRENGKRISVTMELWCGNTLCASWSGSGTNYVTASGSYTDVQRGKTYTLKAYGTAGGRTFTVTPISKKA